MILFIRVVLVCFLSVGTFCSYSAAATAAETPPTPSLRIGVIASLSSFAANYGQSQLEGIQLAVSELEREGAHIELFVEDDQSNTKQTVSAYKKLVEVNRVQAIIGASWWANAIVKNAERDNITLLSCETLYNEDIVLGRTTFVLNGDLRDWMRVYAPLIKAKGWKNGAIIRYISGFGATLAKEMKLVLEDQGGSLGTAIEYADPEMSDYADIALKIKRARPDVLYVDGQPQSIANLLRKFRELNLSQQVILSNSIVDDMRRDNLLDLSPYPNLYFTKRASFDVDYAQRFRAKYHKEPYLNGDLGYYAVYLLHEALHAPDPLAALKSGIRVKGKEFSFDEHNVAAGLVQEVFQIAENP